MKSLNTGTEDGQHGRMLDCLPLDWSPGELVVTVVLHLVDDMVKAGVHP